MNDHDNKYYIKNLTRVGWYLWLSGGCSLYRNGDGTGVKLNWWHPIATLIAILILLYAFLSEGYIGLKECDNPFRVTKWFRDNPSRYEVILRRGNWRG